MKPVQIGGPFPSVRISLYKYVIPHVPFQFLGRHEPLERTKGSFGTNWQRLCEIKQFYDPKNMFRNTFWPLNETGEEVEAYLREPPTPPFLPTSIRGQKKKIFI